MNKSDFNTKETTEKLVIDNPYIKMKSQIYAI